MKKFGIIVSLITILILGMGAYFLTREKEVPTVSAYEYFWGEGCPHCKIVNDFFENWDQKDKITINKYDVYNDKNGANLLNERSKTCKLNPSTVGVPFLVTLEGKCVMGDEPIIDYFNSLDL